MVPIACTEMQVRIEGCAPAAGGVGIDLTHSNIIIELRPDTAAARAAEAGTGLQIGDRIVSVDGITLNDKVLTAVIQPGDVHEFEVERTVGWSGFSIEGTDVTDLNDDDGFVSLNRIRAVTVQKRDGQLGINPEVHCPDGQKALVKVAKVYPGTHASACGIISIGDTLVSINGQSLACGVDDQPLAGAMKVLAEVRDGVDITLEIESDVLLAGWIQKKGEKGFLGAKAAWQKRWMMLIWSDTNMTEREIRYYKGQDTNTRKQKGAIDLMSATDVKQSEIEGAAGLMIDTPERVWELLPASREEAVAWYTMLNQLLARKRGLAVTSSMSHLAVDVSDAAPVPGELTVLLERKLGMSINKLGDEIVIAELEPDGAAAACGLLSVGDALDEVNGSKTESCRQTIKKLMDSPAQAHLRVYSKVVHGGWMHKLGEGLGGWTTRYFTLTYELDLSSVPRVAGAGNTAKVEAKLDAKRDRPRATSVAATGGTSSVLVHLHKANRADKLGLTLAEDDEGRVVLQRIYEGYVAATSAGLLVGDVLVSVNGKSVSSQPGAHKLLCEAVGPLELRVTRSQQSGCWMLRYYEGKNSVTRVERGCIKLSRSTVREINKYTLQEDSMVQPDEVPRVGLYILQGDRCWELLPPEEELDLWISKLQLAVFEQEVIATEYMSPDKHEEAAQRVRDLKGAHYLTLQQQYGLMLATYKDKSAAPVGSVKSGTERMSIRSADFSTKQRDGAPEKAPPPAKHQEAPGVYIMSLEMDGAGACNGFVAPDDRVLEVDGVKAETLQQVTKAFRESRDTVRLKLATKIVHGGMLLKKGEVNTTLQPRWFMLSDDDEKGSMLRYYDGRNAVTRTLKGEIPINPHDVSMVRTFTHEYRGEKRLAVRITTPNRAWELVAARHDSEARTWAELLNARIRRRLHRPTLSGAAAVSEVTEAQALAAVGSKDAGVVPETTRL